MKYKQSWIILLLLLILSIGIFLLSRPVQEFPSFWVLTELSKEDGMNLQLRLAVEQLRQEEPKLEVNVEILPTDEGERDIRLQQIRTQIMAGKGPDVFLMPTGSTIIADSPEWNTKISIKPLFPDVDQAMRIGLFADISTLYNQDNTLDKSALNQAVMDAGCVGDARYVLPLRYTMPVLFLNKGQDTDVISQAPTLSLVNGEDSEIGCNLDLSSPFSGLPQFMDYDSKTLNISAAEMADYLQTYQQWRTERIPYESALCRAGSEHAFLSQSLILQSILPEDYYIISYENYGELVCYISCDVFWFTSGLPAYSGDLGNALETAALAKVTGTEIEMLPYRAANGTISAEVTYYGAVNRNTNYPEQSYALLRSLLTEEYQWDLYRPANTDQYAGLVEFSWPVRTVGSAAPMWRSIQRQGITKGFQQEGERRKIARKLVNREFILEDADIPALGWTPDSVRFPLSDTAYASALETLNSADGTPTDTDIYALAKRLCELLSWHLTEG